LVIVWDLACLREPASAKAGVWDLELTFVPIISTFHYSNIPA
jgi:hypothetical protein